MKNLKKFWKILVFRRYDTIMRYSVFSLLACFLSLPAMAQTIDWKSIGRPLDDDTRSMMDRYVYMNVDSIDRNIGLDNPVLSQTQIQDWIRNNLGLVMSLNGEKIESQMMANRLKFTPKGYGEYVRYLHQSNLFTFLKTNQFKTGAYVEGTPEFLALGLRDLMQAKNTENSDEQDGMTKYAYVWQLRSTLILNYLDYSNNPPEILFKDKQNTQIENRFPVVVEIELIRIPFDENENFIAINSIRFSAAK